MDVTPVQTVGSLYIITGIHIALFPTHAMEGPSVEAVGSLLTSEANLRQAFAREVSNYHACPCQVYIYIFICAICS